MTESKDIVNSIKDSFNNNDIDSMVSNYIVYHTISSSKSIPLTLKKELNRAITFDLIPYLEIYSQSSKELLYEFAMCLMKEELLNYQAFAQFI